MDKKKNKKGLPFWLICLGVFSALVILALIGAEIYAWGKYANVPISEVPVWAWLLMFGGDGGK